MEWSPTLPMNCWAEANRRAAVILGVPDFTPTSSEDGDDWLERTVAEWNRCGFAIVAVVQLGRQAQDVGAAAEVQPGVINVAVGEGWYGVWHAVVRSGPLALYEPGGIALRRAELFYALTPLAE